MDHYGEVPPDPDRAFRDGQLEAAAMLAAPAFRPADPGSTRDRAAADRTEAKLDRIEARLARDDEFRGWDDRDLITAAAVGFLAGAAAGVLAARLKR